MSFRKISLEKEEKLCLDFVSKNPVTEGFKHKVWFTMSNVFITIYYDHLITVNKAAIIQVLMKHFDKPSLG